MLGDLSRLAQKLEADDTVKVVVFQSANPEIFVDSRISEAIILKHDWV